ncbi:MAG: histidine phosphatase family protein [Deltaproteobacteria bacterium]|nr:histidine phosphatase family protein [Deltaproteobacteria bacterium]
MGRFLALILIMLGLPDVAQANEALWNLLKEGGQVAVIRHASTEPGMGDPPGFRVDNCATQRNLSASGREEARRIGAAFRDRGVPVGRVLSSRWCRCLETAEQAFGTVEPWAALDSFFDDRSREPEQTRQVRLLAGNRPQSGNLVLVTHQVNIRALTGIGPGQGEMIILTPLGDGNFRVAGRLRPAEPDWQALLEVPGSSSRIRESLRRARRGGVPRP